MWGRGGDEGNTHISLPKFKACEIKCNVTSQASAFREAPTFRKYLKF